MPCSHVGIIHNFIEYFHFILSSLNVFVAKTPRHLLCNHRGIFPFYIIISFKGGMLFYVNNIEYSGASSFGMSPTIIENSVSVVKPDANRLRLTSTDGSGILIRDEKNHLIVTIVLEDGLFGKTKGLMGNWSGSTDDDWLLPDGTILSPPLTDEQIHFDFGEKCKFFSFKRFFMPTGRINIDGAHPVPTDSKNKISAIKF